MGERKAEVKSESLCCIPRVTVEVLSVRPMEALGLIPVGKQWRLQQQHVDC